MCAAKRWFRAQSIGTVVRGDTVPDSTVFVDPGAESILRIDPRWQAGLAGLDGFSHLVVMAWLDKAQRRRSIGKPARPDGREEYAPVGFFITRTPKRPNPIGICCPRLIGIDGNDFHVVGLDFWDGTPLIDIKAYFPRDEGRPNATVPEWLTKLWLQHDLERDSPDDTAANLETMQTGRGSVVFRHSTIADAPVALAYINSLSAEQTFILMQGEQLTLADEVAWFEGINRQRTNGDAVHLVAMAGDEIVGIAQTNREPRVFAHTVGLGVSIAQEWRGLGLGRRLMELLLAETGRLLAGVEMVQLACFATNTTAIALYQSLGFVECGRIPGKIRHRGELVDEVLMTRPLSAKEAA